MRLGEFELASDGPPVLNHLTETKPKWRGCRKQFSRFGMKPTRNIAKLICLGNKTGPREIMNSTNVQGKYIRIHQGGLPM